MRPIVYNQNLLIHPLNELLSTEAHVRILRVLANDVEGSLTATDAAEKAGITIQGAFKAIKRLNRSGYVIQVGGGRKRQFILRRNDELVKALLNLFNAESDRYNLLIESIIKKIKIPKNPPRSVWIESYPLEHEDPIVLGVIHQTRFLSIFVNQFRKELQTVEEKFDITIEVLGYTKADIPELPVRDIKLLYGLPPYRENNIINIISKNMHHQNVDENLLKVCRVLASFIERDTSLVRRARRHVKKLLSEDNDLTTKDLNEWEYILDSYSPRRLSNFLSSKSERATKLRQSCPFLAILTNGEKKQLIEKLKG
jgi:DNA-binding MarR family transcriptional regulator